MSTRAEQIQQALVKLEGFKGDPAYADRRYAIDANVGFLEAARSLPAYLWWLLTVAPKLDGSRLLELTDFPVEEWDIAMHERLIEVERNDHIGLGKPLVDKILEYIHAENRPLVLINLGAGGREVDRQVITALLKEKYAQPVVFVGVDKSQVTLKIARENLASLGKEISIIEREYISQSDLDALRASNTGITVVACKNDIFALDRHFAPQSFDLLYHSLFRHHLSTAMHKDLDAIIYRISKRVFEYDGFRTWRVIIPQTIVGWRHVIFLNGTIFSNLRFDVKEVVSARFGANARFYPGTGHYLADIRNFA